MIASDILLIAALAVFVAAWWIRTLPSRFVFLAGAAGLAFAAGVWGYLDHRWQAAGGVFTALIFAAALAAAFLRRKRSASGLPFITGSLFALLAVASAGLIWMFPAAPLPKPSGPHLIGVRSFELADASRPGLFAAAETEPRRLLVRVWYPAAPDKRTRPARYFSDAEATSTAQSVGSLVGFPPLLAYLKHVRTNSHEGAPLIDTATGLPVIVFSHGYTFFLGQNTALMEHLASHGYAVYSVQHTYDSAPTVFPDGSVVPTDPAMFESLAGEELTPAMKDVLSGETPAIRLNGQIVSMGELRESGARIFTQSAPIWTADIAFVLDQLAAGAVPEVAAPIAAASDFSRTGHAGMSFGGSTAGGFCAVDARCAAGVNIDGFNYHPAAFAAAMPVPFLMLHADMDSFYTMMTGAAPSPPRSFNEFSYELPETAGNTPGLYRLQVKGAAHVGFSDFSLFIRRPVRDTFIAATPSREMIGIQNDLVRGFFDRHLLGRETDFPATEINAHAPWLTPLDNTAIADWWATVPEEEREAFRAGIEAKKTAAPP